MAQTRNLATSYGRVRRYYVKTQATPTSLWIAAASADTEAQLVAAVARVRARRPECAIQVVEYGANGQRVLETRAAA